MEGNATVPRVELNSLPLRTETFSKLNAIEQSSTPHFDFSQLPQYKDFTTLGRFIRKCMQRQAGAESAHDAGFLPLELLRHILCEEVVTLALEREGRGFEPSTTTNIVFNANFEDHKKKYLVILALLSLSDKIYEIAKLQEDDGICDQDLPLELHSGDDGSFELRRKGSQQRIHYFDSWTDNERKFFGDTQWRLLVPIFSLNPDRTVQHQDLEPMDILPWQKEETVKPHVAISGGYGRVAKVKIHPLCHRYHEILKAINISGGLFAIKTLKHTDDAKFKNEVKMLKQFNGLIHDHLVTLLGTFTHNHYFSMIFPWAECDVEYYWEEINPRPNSNDFHFVRWVSSQCRGVMEALEVIHNPPHLLKDQVSGRHGDIKPENILWFPSPVEGERGIWVISDLGLSAFNREESRSMIPNQSITWTPSYRPPECDLEGGKISRAFDVWTLGCFYLEMLCWLLGGAKLKDDFRKKRTTIYIHGAESDIFFDLELNGMDKTNETYVVLVKTQVAKMINTLHNDPHCTDYIHDFLDIIETDMLVVLSAEQTRERSPSLLDKLKGIHEKCGIEDYCLKKTPKECQFQPPLRIEAKLSEKARDMIARHKMLDKLSKHIPDPDKPIHRSLRPDELDNVDQLSLPRTQSRSAN